MTTPYILIDTPKADWVAFLKRTMLHCDGPNDRTRLHNLLKFGLEPHYWNEFVFKAYHHHQQDAVFLTGIPDMKRHCRTHRISYMATSKPRKWVTGRWLIEWIDQWDRDYIDAEVEGYFEFDARDSGDFQFGYVQGQIDYRLGKGTASPPSIHLGWQ